MTEFSSYQEASGVECDDIEDIDPVHSDYDSTRDLFKYKVPVLSPDGTCSASHELAESPYDLREILQVNNDAIEQNVREQLQTLYDLLEGTQQLLKADWIGIYQVATNAQGLPVLVKLAYQGSPSRAEFPLTNEFATLSNNSTVGLSGKGVVIQSVSAHKDAYYECDANVNSEACLPIYDKDFKTIIGIVDAEAFEDGFFDEDKVAIVAKLCQQLNDNLPVARQRDLNLDRTSL